jgi:hypothetical protein
MANRNVEYGESSKCRRYEDMGIAKTGVSRQDDLIVV